MAAGRSIFALEAPIPEPGHDMGIGAMKHFRRAGVALLLGATLLSTGVVVASPSTDLDEALSYDGLKKVAIKDVDLAYVLPGATLAGYHRVMLDPVYVAFQKDWNPTTPGSVFKISVSDREKIKKQSAKLVYDAFVKELQSKDGYPIVTEAAPDVLRVKISIINLYITAPDLLTPGRSVTFTSSSGHATVLAELFDSETGAALARVIDTQVARDDGLMRMSSGVSNAADGRAAATRWAKVLRRGLDRAREQTGPDVAASK